MEILEGLDFTRGMTLKCDRHVLPIHPFPIILDANEVKATGLEFNHHL
jgi:hypothetical protein